MITRDTQVTMAENNEGKSPVQEENKENAKPRTKHTWIGDKDEIRPDQVLRPVSSSTYYGDLNRKTKLVERKKKPYKGFITDEEVKFAEAAAEVDRRAREESQAAREELARTRIYRGFDSVPQDPDAVRSADADKADDEEKQSGERKPKNRIHRIRIADDRKFRRLTALLVVFILLIAFEVSFLVMKAQTSSLPGKTKELRNQTEQIRTENAGLEKENEELGDVDDIKENRDSWQRIKDKLEK